MKLDGDKVRWQRDRHGWTLEETAERAEVALGTILRAEHGEDIRQMSGRRIARAFDVDVAELVPDKPETATELVGAGKGEAPETGLSEGVARARTRSRAEGHLTFYGRLKDISEEQTRELLAGILDGRITVKEAQDQVAAHVGVEDVRGA